MATLLLVRHGRTTANASGLLAGRTPGVVLDDTGVAQAARAGARIAAVPIARLVTSPQERCKQTAKAVAEGQRGAGHPVTRASTEKALAECDYGDWQGQAIKDLLKEPLWRTVQQQPSAVTFPGGESMVAMQHRAVAAVRRIDAAVTAEHGADAVWVAVSHGDIIKSLLADALGMHLDLFQRINVDPASVSVIRYAPDRPYVLASNTHDGDLSWMRKASPSEGAVVGGGAGPA
jgi:probable phosphomutase (TIGR03848 family)